MDSSLPSQQVNHGKEEIDQQTPEINSKKYYKERIANLPKEKFWNSLRNSLGDLYFYQGFWCRDFFLEGIMSAQDHFKPQSTDIVVASCLKTGTTWLKALTFAIVTRARFEESSSPLLTKLPHDCVPFLEVDLAENSRNRDMEIPLVATHIPYHALPKSVVTSGCKMVYIWRDVKDAFVSYWHFINRYLSSENIKPIPLTDGFEMYCKGHADYGPYWEHILGYWKASLECPDKILFLKYEELKKDTMFYVKKLAEFVGYPFTIEEEEAGVVQKIINLCSFENLSNLEVNKTGKHREDTSVGILNKIYFRKGVVGGWKSDLTEEMGARLDMIMEEKLKGSGLSIS